MEPQLIATSIGTIAINRRVVPDTTPVLFLHGVYYDHRLWDRQVDQLTERTTLTLDMPLHGNSTAITEPDWTLADCATMLIEVIDALGYARVYAIGHSWGSMTVLRAATRVPERFAGIGLCNMPLTAGTLGTKLRFSLQHLLLPFRNFYTTQAAGALFGIESRNNPELLGYLRKSMGRLSASAVRRTDRAVIMSADDGTLYVRQLNVPALALKGTEDYVGTPPGIATTTVPGGHTSPLEQPAEVTAFLRRVLAVERPASNG